MGDCPLPSWIPRSYGSNVHKARMVPMFGKRVMTLLFSSFSRGNSPRLLGIQSSCSLLAISGNTWCSMANSGETSLSFYSEKISHIFLLAVLLAVREYPHVQSLPNYMNAWLGCIDLYGVTLMRPTTTVHKVVYSYTRALRVSWKVSGVTSVTYIICQ